MDGWIDGLTFEGMDGWMNACTEEYMEIWVAGYMNEWTMLDKWASEYNL